MIFKIIVIQTLRVEKSCTIEVEAPSFDQAVELLSSGEIDIPSASDDADAVWSTERSSLEDEAYFSHEQHGTVSVAQAPPW